MINDCLIDWLIDWSYLFRLMLLLYMYTGDGAVGVTTMLSLLAPRIVCVTAYGATGRCGIVTLTAPLCSSVYTLRIYICHHIVARANMFMTFMFCFTIITTCNLGMVLSVWPLYRRLWRHGLYLWQPAVPPVDVGSSHWQHLCVLVFIPYEYWSSLFRLMLLRNNVHWGQGCQCDDLLSLVAPRVVFVKACSATGRCGVITLTAATCSNACIPQIYMLSFRQVHTYWYLSSLALRPNGRHI